MRSRKYRLPEKPHAVVTGGGSGIGRAFCLELALAGGLSIVADRCLESAEETVRLIEEKGGQGVAFECDVTRPEAMESLASLALEQLGRVDLLVNNAGVVVGGLVGDVPLEDWGYVMDVNLWGVIYGCHYFVPILRAQGRGLIVNVASVAGLISAPELGPYNVTKAAVVSLSSTLRAELSATDIGVTVLAPSMVKTRLMGTMRSPDTELHILGASLMEMAGASAESVVKTALARAQRGHLYVLPQLDAKFAWSLQRLTPTFERWVMKLIYNSRWFARWRGSRAVSESRESDTREAD